MVDQLLQFARGPLFIATFLFMILALGRLFFMQLLAIPNVFKNTNDKEIDKKEVAWWIGEWLVPIKHFFASRPVFSLISFIWHIGLIFIPLFLVDHILLWNRGLGIGWPLSLSISKHTADLLSVIVVAMTLLMLILRAASRESRFISGFMDYFLLVLLAVPFITGVMAAHPTMSPISYNLLMLIHILSAEAIFILMPLTKLAHSVLFPFGRMSTFIYWKFPEGSGDRIAHELFGEEAKV